MAGHSKWANIKHTKARQDAKRGKVFTKLIREITVAARLGGADESANPRLRAALIKAYSNNMPKDTVERAIKRGAGNNDSENLIEVIYEGYGPKGVAIMVTCLTDNKNRTVAEVRHAFSKCGGNLGTDGSVAYLFNKVGQLVFSPPCDEAQIMEIAIDAGAEDIHVDDDKTITVTTAIDDFNTVRQALATQQIEPSNADITLLASTQVLLDDEDDATQLLRLVDMLEDCDDVQNVYTNADFSDSLLAKL